MHDVYNYNEHLFTDHHQSRTEIKIKKLFVFQFFLLLSLFLSRFFFINSGDLLFHWRHLHTSIFQRKYYLKRSLLETSFWLKTFKNFQYDFLLNSKFHTNLDKLQEFQMKFQQFFEKISLYLEYFFRILDYNFPPSTENSEMGFQLKRIRVNWINFQCVCVYIY